MTKRMLIDATHAEETRVVVLDGNRLEDFDVETSTKRHLKGNIYLAKVIRVEPSLQAAFVEFGGNRHGFLAFSEIHPDYYQIPVADRQRLIELQAEEARREQEEEDRAAAAEAPDPGGLPERNGEADEDAPPAAAREESDTARAASTEAAAETETETETAAASDEIGEAAPIEPMWARPAVIPIEIVQGPPADAEPAPSPAEEKVPFAFSAPAEAPEEIEQNVPPEPSGLHTDPGTREAEEADGAEDHNREDEVPETPPPETMGGEADAAEERQEHRIPPRFLRNYKIQEVIRRRQILLVQVVKEERGTKGAALTTYISLAGRYCVLMPNSPRGGGISRKITAPADRRRLKEVIAELDLPDTMGLIVRTAGANRPKQEIKRDCEYLLRLWDEIRDLTLRSVAPALIYEEASLIKRAIRDVYSRDIDEIIVDGEAGWKAAREFMRMLMPTHAKKVQLWQEPQPLFARMQVEAQLDALMSPTVQLRSGGYLVINQTEALVAIDVNSGRSTRERNVEETALRTNLEAADEAARQLRLRDLAGLIVIDFIDMESRKHNASVEKRLKEALKSDRARIQVGHISHFGLLEMSRQRLRPSVAETNFILCPHCGGTGHLRSTESAAVHVLRGVEEEAAKRRSAEAVVHVALPIAMYILNHKRDRLSAIEDRHGLHVTFAADDTLIAPQFRIDRVRPLMPGDLPETVRAEAAAPPPETEAEEAEAAEAEDEEMAGADAPRPGETAEEAENRRRRRRRRRRGARREDGAPESAPAAGPSGEEALVEGVPEMVDSMPAEPRDEERDARRRRSRHRRRGRRDEVLPEIAAPGAEQPDVPALGLYTGPTPANPFGGQGFDIFEALEQAEQQRSAAPARPMPEPAPATVTPEADMPQAPHPEPYGGAGDAPEAGQPEPAPPPPAASAPEPSAGNGAEPVPAEEEPPPPAPAVLPILVGAEPEPPAERKRGWWRR
ncbi:MAG TPA: Rne/Rng family ribonuclease [Acetobacteraceae bacterium]|nr:Rne/Rng family ribonuclease [Acetobacteraceae bacterium]